MRFEMFAYPNSCQDRTEHNYIRTFSGRKFWPLNPRAEDICIEDVAHHLSNECRFSGATYCHYSVADHALRVSRLAERMVLRSGRGRAAVELAREVALWGLHHDDTEAYLKDFPRPIKHSYGLGDIYRSVEKRLTEQVILCFDLMPHEPSVVKEADEILGNTEGRDLVTSFVVPPGAETLRAKIRPLSAYRAEEEFIRRHTALMMARTVSRAAAHS